MFSKYRPHVICITVHSRRVQGACCLDIGFRHMFSAHDGAAHRRCMCHVAGGVGKELKSHCINSAVSSGMVSLVGGVLPNHLGRGSGCQYYVMLKVVCNYLFIFVFV